MKKHILMAGESWTSTTTHAKGFDTFTTTVYEEGGQPLIDALEVGGYEVTYMPSHVAQSKFPRTIEEISKYDLVILSDIGSNTLLIAPEVFTKGVRIPNRCRLIRQYVEGGGALLMVGGYMTFTGVDAKARYGMTEIKHVLPVSLLETDDRVECPEGIVPKVEANHPIFAGIAGDWPHVLGYNRTKRARDKGEVIASFGYDPFIAIGEFGQGKSCAYTTDCSPHWAPPEFVSWAHYQKLFQNIAGWLTT